MKTSFVALPALALLTACSALGIGSPREDVYIVEASGGAWGAATKARAAMVSVDGIDRLHMSGARAVFTVEAGAEVTEEDLAAAFEAQGMEVTSFGEHSRPLPKARYTIDAGITWATTAGKVREALIENSGALDVYFEEQVEILVLYPEQFDVAAVEELMSELKVEYTTVEAAP